MSVSSYTVLPGDNLTKIAKMFFDNENRVEDIVRLNELANPNQIEKYQILKLPLEGQIDVIVTAEIYNIKKGDTLERVSRRFYKTGIYANRLAELNGIADVNLIFIGQQLQIPTIDEIAESPTNPIIKHTTKAPHGFNEVIKTFGDPRPYLLSSGGISSKWTSDHFTTIDLPFKMRLSFNSRQFATRMLCHKKIAPIFLNVFYKIKSDGLDSKIHSYGGCYNFRAKRKSNSFSTHSWGIAVDINPLTNMMGTKGDMDPSIINIFQSNGFKWGGDWNGKYSDPMHFQYATGY